MHAAPIASTDPLAERLPRAASRARRAVSPARERARQRLVGVVFLIYMLLIFEGAIRKWLLPQFSAYIFFIRDPLVLYAYVLAVHHSLWPKRSPFFVAMLVAAVLGFLLGMVALVANSGGSTESMLAVYGWRNYFLYAPLAFLIGAQFSVADLARVFRWTLFLCAPIGLLVAAQFFAPLSSVLNVGSATDVAQQFIGLTTTAERTRPMGTFSSGAGQIQFVASAFAILLGLLITPKRGRPIKSWWLVVAAGGLATCLAFGGSRAAVLHCALIALIGMGLGIVGRTAAVKMRAVALPLLLAAAFVASYPIVFPEGFAAFTERWEAADRAETRMFETGVFGRALYGFVDFVRLLADAPVIGYGLGMGGNASITLDVKVGNGVYAETDWARHIVDLGPVLGPAFIALRVAMTIWLGMLVLKATRRGAGPLPIVLFAYVGYVLLSGQITGQGAINGYAWLFTGFTIAAAAARPAPAISNRPRRRFGRA